MTIQENTGLQIKQFRAGKKLTQKQLAEAAGLTDQTVRRYEQGKNQKIEELERIAQAMGLKLIVLLFMPDQEG